MENALRRDQEWEEDLPLEDDDLQASGVGGGIGMGAQQGRSKSEHSQTRGRRYSASIAASVTANGSVAASGRAGQLIHNRDPHAPHTANHGAGSHASEAGEGRAGLS